MKDFRRILLDRAGDDVALGVRLCLIGAASYVFGVPLELGMMVFGACIAIVGAATFAIVALSAWAAERKEQ